MSMQLETSINQGLPSNFIQRIFSSDKRDGHRLSILADIGANTSSPVGTAELITVDFATLKNYYKYTESGGKTDGMSAREVTNLKAFIDTIGKREYDEKTGQLLTMHNLSLSDSAGNVYMITIVFSFDRSGEITAAVQINKDAPAFVFSMKAYEAYEKIIYSEKVTEAEREMAYGFYTVKGVSASSKYLFDKIVGTTSDGITSIFEEHKITKTDKDGKTTVDYCLSSDYRVFFNVSGEDLIGVAGSFVRYYDTSDSDGSYETIKDFPYKFKASKVRLITAGKNGGTDTIEDGTLGDGDYTVEVTENMVIVTDAKGNITRYLRYAGTSGFSGLYSSFIYASYEGLCEIPKEQKDEFIKNDNCDIRITFDTKLSPDENGKGEVFDIKLFEYSERRSFVTMNGKGNFFVLTNFFERIINSSKQVFENVQIDPIGKN
jgi:hypothetical protein